MLRIRIRIPEDPYVFGPPGSASGSVNHKYGPGSGSFLHQTKIVRKTLISTILWLIYDFLSLKNDVNVPVFRIRIWIRIRIFLSIRIRISYSEVWIRASGSVPICHGSATLVPTRHTYISFHCVHMQIALKRNEDGVFYPIVYMHICILLHTDCLWIHLHFVHLHMTVYTSTYDDSLRIDCVYKKCAYLFIHRDCLYNCLF